MRDPSTQIKQIVNKLNRYHPFYLSLIRSFRVLRRRNRRKALAIILTLTLTLTAFRVWAFISPPEAEAGWFDDDWTYRQKIVISKTVGAETNVYVAFDDADRLDTNDSTKFQSDCGDIRFTTEGGILLPYIVNSGCISTTTDIDVLFDSISVADHNIYMYYGNANAPDGFEASGFSTEATNYTIGTPASEEVGPGPVAYWKFDEGADNTCPGGEDACDTTANSNDGTFGATTAAPTWQSEDMCVNGKCLSFDGSDDYLSVDNTNLLQPSAGTVSLWVKTTSNQSESDYFIFSHPQTGTDSRVYIRTNATGTVIRTSLGTNADFGTKTIATNTWHHVSLTWDGSSGAMYVDGNEITSGSITALTDTNAYLYIGSIQNSDENFSGFIDEVKIYPYARTAAEIKQDFLGGGSKGSSASFGPDNSFLSDGLVGYWKMDEASDVTSVTDFSGNGNDGTISLWGGGNTATSSARLAGKFGGGIDFDGEDDYISVTQDTSLEPTSGITMAAWVNVTNLPSTSGGGETDHIYSNVHNSGYEYSLNVNGGYSQEFMMEVPLDRDGVEGSRELRSTFTPTVDAWYHVVATYDSKDLKMYVDGDLKNEFNDPATLITPTSGSVVAIGGRSNSDQEKIDGTLDDLRIYNRALSPSEVAKLSSFGPGPVAHWKLDENTGTSSVNDTSTNSNTATMTGTMTESDWVPGKFGSALDFDGSDDALTVATASDSDLDFNGSEEFSGSAWIYSSTVPASATDQDAIIAKWDETSSLRAYRVFLENDDTDSTGHITVEIMDESTAGNEIITVSSANDSISEDTWYHTAFTFNGGTAGAAGDLELYVDGVSVGTNSANASFLGLEDLGSDFTIADYDTTDVVAANTAFTGIIDDIRMYHYVRTAGQVVEDMNAGHPAPGSPVGSAVGHWKFDEGYGTTAQDSSTNNNDLTLSTAAWTNSGKFGKAWDGNGTVTITKADDPDFDFSETDDLTISGWFQHDTIATNPDYILTKAQAGTNAGYKVYMASDGDIVFEFDDDSTWDPDDQLTTTSADYDDNAWHHFVAVKDDTTASYLYIDGELKVKNISVSSTATLANNDALYIGVDDDGSSNPFDGQIDDLRIYASELTADQIKLLYNQGFAASFGATSANTAGSGSKDALSAYCPPGSTDSCTGPVGEWNFDENTGTTQYDTSGNGNDLEFDGGSSMTEDDWVPGKIGSAIEFDGTNDDIENTSVSSDLNITGDMTITLWMYRNGTASDDGLVQHNGDDAPEGGNINYQAYINDTDNVIRFFWEYGGVPTTEINDSTVGLTNASGSWVHIGITRDVTANEVIFYENGVQLGSTVSFTNDPTGGGTTPNFEIGQGSTGDEFGGRIDNVRIYDYERTPAQIAWEYNRGKPVHWYKFDECQGSTIYDSGSGGVNGTLTIGSTDSKYTSIGTCNSGVATEAWNGGTTGKINSSIGLENNDGDPSTYVDDYVTLTDDSNLPTNDFTISAWAYHTDNGTAFIFTAPNSSGGNELSFTLIDPGGDFVYMRGYADGSSVDSLTNLFSMNNQWLHLAMTRSGSTVTFYLNGVPDGEFTLNSTTLSFDCTDFYLSSDVDTNCTTLNQGFNGQLDDIRIFNYALTQEQIKTEFNQGAVRFGE